jgi:hypothetical protein
MFGNDCKEVGSTGLVIASIFHSLGIPPMLVAIDRVGVVIGWARLALPILRW